MRQLRTSDFDYPLPKELIAQYPADPRDNSRLMVLERGTGELYHHRFNHILGYFELGDLIVFNNSRVIPARLRGKRVGTGGNVELLLLRRHAPNLWWCLARPARSLNPAVKLCFPDGLEATIIDVGDQGLRLVEMANEALMDKVGEIALPPYIHEPLSDPERYQTVYATRQGSVAAPTAGLHFTSDLLRQLQMAGIGLASVTLHIGMDTFRPVDEEDPQQHRIHTEYWELPQATADAINATRMGGGRIIAVGTTTVRVLEQAALLSNPSIQNKLLAGSGWADLYILPGHRFQLIDSLITNFHLPRSTLLMLVSAFASKKSILDAYQTAIHERYRFYSFGDAMLIL